MSERLVVTQKSVFHTSAGEPFCVLPEDVLVIDKIDGRTEVFFEYKGALYLTNEFEATARKVCSK